MSDTLMDKELNAIKRYLESRMAHMSVGIDGETTYGYGKLLDNGYWEYPVPPALIHLGSENQQLKGQIEQIQGIVNAT